MTDRKPLRQDQIDRYVAEARAWLYPDSDLTRADPDAGPIHVSRLLRVIEDLT